MGRDDEELGREALDRGGDHRERGAFFDDRFALSAKPLERCVQGRLRRRADVAERIGGRDDRGRPERRHPRGERRAEIDRVDRDEARAAALRLRARGLEGRQRWIAQIGRDEDDAFAGRLPRDDDRAGRVADDLLRDAAEEHVGEPARAMPAYEEHRRAKCLCAAGDLGVVRPLREKEIEPIVGSPGDRGDALRDRFPGELAERAVVDRVLCVELRKEHVHRGQVREHVADRELAVGRFRVGVRLPHGLGSCGA